jgi:hypothetical protein
MDVEKNLFENTCLCNDCAELEVWESKQHDVKYNVCFIRKLLDAAEKECKNYKEIQKKLSKEERKKLSDEERKKLEEKKKKSSLCQSCIRLEKWHSKLYERIAKEKSFFETKDMELCTAHHILSPSMTDHCSEYIMTGFQSRNVLCRSCTNLTVWQSKSKTIQAEVCKIRHRILPLKYSCEFYKLKGV